MTIDPLAALVTAMLSVNNYSLGKTCSLFDRLQENGLFDPRFLASSEAEEVARRLGSAGYDRGKTMTEIFTSRLISLGGLIHSVPVDDFADILSNGSRDEVSSFLASVKGVGPRVLDNFFILRGDE